MKNFEVSLLNFTDPRISGVPGMLKDKSADRRETGSTKTEKKVENLGRKVV